MRETSAEYVDEFLAAVRHRAVADGLFELEAFAYVFAERLEESDEVRDLVVSPVQTRNSRGKRLELLAYGYDEAEDSLLLAVGKYYGGVDATLTATEARKVFDSGLAFLECAISGWIQQNLEISSTEVETANQLRSYFQGCSAIRMLLVTDGSMSKRIRSIESTLVEGREVHFSIWDYPRLAEALTSATGRESVRIDLTEWLPSGLPALAGSEEAEATTRTFLAVLPGDALAEMFRRYGSRLLESNVRTYLGTAGKINKKIQYTLRHEPSKFLAYNNGLTATATGIETFASSGAIVYIRTVDDLQIVNGGQTTSSLAYYLRKDPTANLGAVSVQMKLVLVEPDEANDLVPNISRYANSQNKVNEADFFSNSEFHVALERISKRVLPPARDGLQYSSGWFYERARGQWENERRALSPAKQREWDLKFPKAQRVLKTDWAKYEMSWAGRPHIVSRGAQANFLAFAAEADLLWEKEASRINELYFKEGVGKAILYNQLRSAVSAQAWYQEGRGYLANIVSYAIARFATAIASSHKGYSLDFEQVWKRQAVGTASLESLILISRGVREVLTSKDRPQANVTQWAKQELCWETVRKMPVELSRGIEGDLVSSRRVVVERRDATRTQRFDNGMMDVERVLNVSRNTFSNVVGNPAAMAVLTAKESSIMRKLANGVLRVPSESQARVVLLALDRLAGEAIISRDEY